MPPKRFLKSPPPTRTLLIRFQALPIARVSILFLNKRERGVSPVCRAFWVPNYAKKGRRQLGCFFKKNAARKRKKISSSKQNKRSDEKRYQIDNLSEDYLAAVAELEAGMRKKPALELYCTLEQDQLPLLYLCIFSFLKSWYTHCFFIYILVIFCLNI